MAADGMDRSAGLGAVGAAFDGAVEHFPGGQGPGLVPQSRLPEGCPVTPLGITGDLCWYLDASGQLRDIKAKEHSQAMIEHLFGRQVHLVFEYWPRHSKDGDVNGWRTEKARPLLFGSCADRGVWDPLKHVRGRGAWVDDAGGLVLHCGDAVFIEGDWRAPGRYGDQVYATAPALPRPLGIAPAGGEAGPAAQIERDFSTWRWRRPDVAPRLALGWLCASKISGALDWRPLAWVTGDQSTGKSTFHKYLRGVSGQSIISVSDTTAAGIWQALGMDAIPVAIDEIEAAADNRKALAVINLAREAASGGVVLRGGQDHHGSRFVAQCCFLFSSILIPPLQPQDFSRIAVLELDPLPEGGRPPDMAARRLAHLGAGLMRRMVDGWPVLAERIAVYREAMVKHRHAGHGDELFATLLACADVALFDQAPDPDTLAEWAEQLRPAEGGDEYTASDHVRCLGRLMSTSVDLQRHSDSRTVASWVAQAGRLRVEGFDGGSEAARGAQEALGRIGLKVEWRPGPDGAQALWLLVASQHSGLEPIYRDTHWAATPGGAGVWVQALRRVAGAEVVACRRFAGHPSRATALPWVHIAPVLERDDDPTDPFYRTS